MKAVGVNLSTGVFSKGVGASKYVHSRERLCVCRVNNDEETDHALGDPVILNDTDTVTVLKTFIVKKPRPLNLS